MLRLSPSILSIPVAQRFLVLKFSRASEPSLTHEMSGSIGSQTEEKKG